MSSCFHNSVKKILVCIIVFAALLLPSIAYADDSGPLKVDLSSSAQSCVSGEEIELTAVVTNEGDTDAYDASYELSLPDSLVADSTSGALDAIAPGESKELKFAAKVVESESLGAIADAGDSGADASGSDAPVTGDFPIAVIAVLVAAIFLAVLGVALARKKSRRSALLSCLVLAIAVGTAAPVAAFADSVSRTAEGSTDIAVNGENVAACLTVSYLTNGGQGDGSSDDADSGSGSDDPKEGIVLKSGVVEIQPNHWIELSSADKTAKVDAEAAEQLKDNPVAIFYPGNGDSEGMSMRVSSVAQSGDAYEVSGSEVQLDDVVESINVNGETSDTVGYEIADGVSIEDESDIATQIGLDGEKPVGQLKLKVFDGATVTVSPSIIYSFKYEHGQLEKCKLAVKNEYKADFEWSVKKDFKEKLLTSTYATSIPGLTITTDLYLVGSASGEVSMEATVTGTSGIDYSDSKLKMISDTDFSYTASFEALLKAGVKPTAIMKFVGLGLADVDAEVGASVHGSLNQRSVSFVCADMEAWMYVDVNAGTGDTLLAKAMDLLKLKKEYHPLSKSNSPKWDIHCENGKKVKKCTWRADDSKDDGDNDTDSGDSDAIEVNPGKTDYPELSDNGYGETPKLENMTGWSSYHNKLVEPFNVNMGKSVSIGGEGFNSVDFGYQCSEGTVFRLTKKEQSGKVISSEVYANVGGGQPCFDDCIWTIEVLCGRVCITDITAWEVPPVTMGTCETIPYPLRLSSSTLSIPAGKDYALEAESDFSSLTNDLDGLGLVWSSDDSTVATVDDNGHVQARKPGSTTIKVKTVNSFFVRSCEVTVK